MDLINLNIKGIKCDNCDYRDNDADFKDYSQYLDSPCPWCGSILLTQKDFRTIKKIAKIANFINRIGRLLRIKPKENWHKTKVKVEMDGTGKAEFVIQEKAGGV